MSQSDDELDDLFSFSTAPAAGATTTTSTTSISDQAHQEVENLFDVSVPTTTNTTNTTNNMDVDVDVEDEFDDFFSASSPNEASPSPPSTNINTNITTTNRNTTTITTPEPSSPTMESTTTSPLSSSSDDGDDDGVLIGGNGDDGGGGDDDLGSGKSGVKMERPSSHDSFLDLEPEPTTTTTTTSTTSTTSPPKEEEEVVQLLQNNSNLNTEDDFHPHDAGTRDFLEWLDTDNAANTTTTPSNAVTATATITTANSSTTATATMTTSIENHPKDKDEVDDLFDMDGDDDDKQKETIDIDLQAEANTNTNNNDNNNDDEDSLDAALNMHIDLNVNQANNSSSSNDSHVVPPTMISNSPSPSTDAHQPTESFDFAKDILGESSPPSPPPPPLLQPQNMTTKTEMKMSLKKEEETSLDPSNKNNSKDATDTPPQQPSQEGNESYINPSPSDPEKKSEKSPSKLLKLNMNNPFQKHKQSSSSNTKSSPSDDSRSIDVNVNVSAEKQEKQPITVTLKNPFKKSLKNPFSSSSKDKDKEKLKDKHELEKTQVTAATATASMENIKVPPPNSIPPPILPTKTFESLSEAIQDVESTHEQIQSLYETQNPISQQDRPHLWIKMLTKKTMNLFESNNMMVEGFQRWSSRSPASEEERNQDINDYCYVDILTEQCERYSQFLHLFQPELNVQDTKESLLHIAIFHGKNVNSTLWDPLLLPLLSTLVTVLPSSFLPALLNAHVFPNVMPFMMMLPPQRLEMTQQLHEKFYLLTAYHLPLLVFHLDRHVPGWYFPRTTGTFHSNENEKDSSSSSSSSLEIDNDSDSDDQIHQESTTQKLRQLESYGEIPMSWFVTFFADEHSLTQDFETLVQLWDVLLISQTPSLKFFLALSVLEEHSNTLLMLQGNDLSSKMKEIFTLPNNNNNNSKTPHETVQQWSKSAHILANATPPSISSQLNQAEDDILNQRLMEQQKLTEQRLEQTLQEDADVHRKLQQQQYEQEQLLIQRETIKTQLIAYYQKYNPEKVDTIPVIMEQFKGRYDVLDDQLKSKYGTGFRSTSEKILQKLQPHKSTSTSTSDPNHPNPNSLSLSQSWKKRISTNNNKAKKKKQELDKESDQDALRFHHHQVAVQVSPEDVLPTVCGSKTHREYTMDSSNIHFYLIDARPEDSARQQGRFPKAISIPPEHLLDFDVMQIKMDMFESLRGAVHICVMGEGFASLPSLYHHELTPNEKALAEQDKSRTDMCALFFIKKGFPFVSTLEGGFAGAHAWLRRKTTYDLNTVLVDYNDTFSLLARLEQSHQEYLTHGGPTLQTKTTRAIQSFLETSMTSLTKSANAIDEFTYDPDSRQKVKDNWNKFIHKAKQVSSSAKLPAIDLNQEEQKSEQKNHDTDTQNETTTSTKPKSMMKLSELSMEKSWNKIFTSKVKPVLDQKENEENDVNTSNPVVEESSAADMESSSTYKEKPSFKLNNPFSNKVSSLKNPFKDVSATSEKDESNDTKTSTNIMNSFKAPSLKPHTFKNPFSTESSTKESGSSTDESSSLEQDSKEPKLFASMKNKLTKLKDIQKSNESSDSTDTTSPTSATSKDEVAKDTETTKDNSNVDPEEAVSSSSSKAPSFNFKTTFSFPKTKSVSNNVVEPKKSSSLSSDLFTKKSFAGFSLKSKGDSSSTSVPSTTTTTTSTSSFSKKFSGLNLGKKVFQKPLGNTTAMTTVSSSASTSTDVDVYSESEESISFEDIGVAASNQMDSQKNLGSEVTSQKALFPIHSAPEEESL